MLYLQQLDYTFKCRTGKVRNKSTVNVAVPCRCLVSSKTLSVIDSRAFCLPRARIIDTVTLGQSSPSLSTKQLLYKLGMGLGYRKINNP